MFSIKLSELQSCPVCGSSNGITSSNASSVAYDYNIDTSSRYPRNPVSNHYGWRERTVTIMKAPLWYSANLLALRGLGTAASRPGAGASVGLSVSALHGVRHYVVSYRNGGWCNWSCKACRGLRNIDRDGPSYILRRSHPKAWNWPRPRSDPCVVHITLQFQSYDWLHPGS